MVTTPQMMARYLFAFSVGALLVLSSCRPRPVHVEVRQIDGQWQLFRGGQPYYIHGAGLEFGDIDRLAEHGANSLRTWRTDNGRDTGQEILDRAHKNGLTVTMGLEIAREREGSGRGYFGFDYDDPVAVAEQLERVRQEVLMYKDHPALLMWGIGNELNLGSTNPRVWDAINDISIMIHELDPHHPTTTMLAGLNPALANDIRQRAPDLDLIAIQSYADIVNLPRYLDEAGWDGPYIVTEWGATGHWEVLSTPWNAPIENTSTVKAEFYRERYEKVIAADTVQCLGSYVFLWGQKQERTPTWYGLFLESGEKTEAVDVMQTVWNGEEPANHSPQIVSMHLDGKTAMDSIEIHLGNTYGASVSAVDADGDSLAYKWEIMPESVDLGHGGDDEIKPLTLPDRFDTENEANVILAAPKTPGPYRLFVYVFDGQGGAGHANIPLLVTE